MGERATRASAGLVIGVGCTRDVPFAFLAESVDRLLREHGLCASDVAALATLDRKRAEAALVELARARGWRLALFSAAELDRAAGEGSELVRDRVGTRAVAEPAAALAADGPLLVAKTSYRDAEHAVTLAVAAPRSRHE